MHNVCNHLPVVIVCPFAAGQRRFPGVGAAELGEDIVLDDTAMKVVALVNRAVLELDVAVLKDDADSDRIELNEEEVDETRSGDSVLVLTVLSKVSTSPRVPDSC